MGRPRASCGRGDAPTGWIYACQSPIATVSSLVTATPCRRGGGAEAHLCAESGRPVRPGECARARGRPVREPRRRREGLGVGSGERVGDEGRVVGERFESVGIGRR
jgi:hypothetical protein